MFGGEFPYSWCSRRASRLQKSARDSSLVEDSQEQRDGIDGMVVDCSPEWQ